MLSSNNPINPRRMNSHPKTMGGPTPTIQSPYLAMFDNFRNELDEHHDRRERIIKASRDITALSKKMIFSLQRIQKLKSALPGNIKKDNDPRIVTIQALYNSIAPDLQGINAWRYQRQISTGVQEYIEATSFQHYLETQRLITLEEAQASICGGKIVLTEEDYLLGLFDLVGEMMKFAITNMATSGSLPRGGGGSAHLLPSVKRDDDEQQQQEEDVEGGGPKKGVRQTESNAGTANDILTDLRSLRTYFEGLDLSGGGNGHHLEKDIRQKMEVMKTSVEKVERAVYGIIIRGRERWAPDWGGAENERGRRDQVEIY